MINSIVLMPLRNGEYIQFLTDTLFISHMPQAFASLGLPWNEQEDKISEL